MYEFAPKGYREELSIRYVSGPRKQPDRCFFILAERNRSALSFAPGETRRAVISLRPDCVGAGAEGRWFSAAADSPRNQPHS